MTQRVADAAERAGFVFAVDPTSAEASCIGGNIAMNAGGKKAVLWGTALDNLASWRMVTPDAPVARSHAPRSQPGPDPRRGRGELRVQDLRADGKTLLRTERLDIRAARVPQRRAWARDVTDKFLAACRDPEGGLRRADHQRALGRAPDAGAHAHGVPGVLRQPEGRGAEHRRDQKDYVFLARRRRRRRCWPASSTWTTAT